MKSGLAVVVLLSSIVLAVTAGAQAAADVLNTPMKGQDEKQCTYDTIDFSFYCVWMAAVLLFCSRLLAWHTLTSSNHIIILLLSPTNHIRFHLHGS